MAQSHRRIAVLGKTGSGKSNLGNTILGDTLFKVDHTFASGTKKSEAKTKEINGQNVTVVDTPGFFDTDSPEEEIKSEILRCITQCADGVHAFLIVLKVEKFTEHEEAVISKVCEYFSEDVLQYASVVFTHGGDLGEDQTIEKLVAEKKSLHDLLKKCGGGCHVFDNKYWNGNDENKYRSNKFQLKKLLHSINEMIRRNKGKCYTNEVLQGVQNQIRSEMEHIRQSSPNMPEEEIRTKAENTIFMKLKQKIKNMSRTQLLLCFLGGVVIIGGVALTIYFWLTAAAVGAAAAEVAAAAAVVTETTAVAAAAATGSAAAATATGSAAAATATGSAAAAVATGSAAAAVATGNAAAAVATGSAAAAVATGSAAAATATGSAAAAVATGSAAAAVTGAVVTTIMKKVSSKQSASK